MGKMKTRRPSPAALLALLALLLALTGTAAAVTKIGTKHLRNRAVTTKKLADGAVSGVKLAGNAVTTPKIEDGAVTGPKVKDGSLDLADVAQVVANVSFNPSQIGVSSCVNSGDIPIPGLQGGDDVLVFARGYEMGWPIDVFLDAYGPTGPGSISVRICNYGISPINPSSLPLRVLAFR